MVESASFGSRSAVLILLLGTLSVMVWPAASWAEPEEPQAEATLPLQEILRLYRESEKAAEATEPEPPLAASLDRLELAGRLLDGAVEITAEVEVTVLASERWVRQPILDLEPSLVLTQLPRLEGAVLETTSGSLALVTRKAGRYRFKLGLLLRGKGEGRAKEATLALAKASLGRLSLQADERLFELQVPGALRGQEGWLLFPHEGRYALRWQERSDASKGSLAEAHRAPVDPVVTSAHASAVSTLEGRLLSRVLYRLRLGGPGILKLEPPSGQQVERVYRNGVAVAVEGPLEGVLELAVEPSRQGDQEGTLEVVLARQRQGFNLSGNLHYTLPRVSWPIHELNLVMHLPSVFEYNWVGGSLAPVEKAPGTRFTHVLPTPGKTLAFRQMLITGAAPSLRIDYDINLEDQYFCHRGGQTG